MKYKYTPPKYFKEQEVSFIDAHGIHRIGIIRWVETHYSSKHEAYHIYWIQVEGLERRRHATDENIICIINPRVVGKEE